MPGLFNSFATNTASTSSISVNDNIGSMHPIITGCQIVHIKSYFRLEDGLVTTPIAVSLTTVAVPLVIMVN